MTGTDGRQVAVVVDGYSAGNFFPAAFAPYGVRLVHVRSTPELIPTMSPPNLSEYDENIVMADEAALVERLRRDDPVCLVPGQESAVELADRLSETLGLPSNGSALSRARRDKYEMIEALRRAGVRCARQLRTADPAAVAAWAEGEAGAPVVVKPLSSAATDGVYVCATPAEARSAAERVLAARDIFGFRNTEVLVQSYLAGTEYIIDTVSSDGHRYACGVWRYAKTLLPSGKNIYDKDILVDPDAAPAPELVAYVDEVLDALGIRWGAAHSEVIVTEDGPVLVEVGARVNGNIDPGFHDACLGGNQAALDVRAYLRPAEFQKEYGNRVYQKLRSGIVYNAATDLDGVVTAVDETAVAEIGAVPGVHKVLVKLRPGGRIRPTVDLLTSPLRVFLVGGDDDQVLAAYERVRELTARVYRID
jgi:carbamoylphosphate synthase large subunit